MSGLNPSTTGIYNSRQAFRMSPVGFDAVTLPRYFSNHGYFSTGVGKITHGKFPDPASWDDFYPNLRTQDLKGAVPAKRNRKGVSKGFDWGPMDVADSELQDGKITQHAIDMLGEKYDKPFFMACGWRLPHLPWYAPRKYFDLYDPAALSMPLVKDDDLDDVPPLALAMARQFQKYEKVTKANKQREGVQAYLASISFIDAQVGRVLDALKSSQYADNTIVVFLGDHGWHLGEKKHWSKMTLWEESTRTPLMIMAPHITPGRCTTPISFLDIYPTLVELCGLPPKKELEGTSLVALMKDPNTKGERPALTTYGKDNHSLRSKRWRYTIYRDGGEELYDHDNDKMEWHNLADNPDYANVKARLKKWLPTTNADDVYVLKWPQEERKYWESTLKAAERYHGKSVYT